MRERVPLSALLSQTLVAFTIEADNETDHRMPHSTTRHGSTGGGNVKPWLTSIVMWMNCMRYVPPEGVSAREVVRQARTRTHFKGMLRWGYISIKPPEDAPDAPHAQWIVRPTQAGKQAQQIWRTMLPEIEERWEQRFGSPTMSRLKSSLSRLVSHLPYELPDCLPILQYGLWSAGRAVRWRRSEGLTVAEVSHSSLFALLSKSLLAFAIEFEEVSDLSLAISANLLRLIPADGVRVRDLPRLSGVSKEAIAMGLGFLTTNAYAAERSMSKARVVRLTAKGGKAEQNYHKLVGEIEDRWKEQFGEGTIDELREVLEMIAGDATADSSPLFQGLKPYPEGWRAAVKRPETLPHFPMVLHRGGFPDGS